MRNKEMPTATKKRTEKIMPDVPLDENCLEGLVFVFAGDLKHFTRETAKEFVTSRGGQFRTSITKKTNYVVTGEEPSEKKMEGLKDRDDVEVVKEDAFIEMVTQRSNKPRAESDEKVEENVEEEVEETEVHFSNKRKKTDSTKSRKKTKEEQENLELQEEELDIEGAALVGGSD